MLEQSAALSRLCCMQCGARIVAACSCEAPYVTAGERARAAVEENPHLSNLAIAKRLGVNEITVRRARKSLGSTIVDPDMRLCADGRLQPAHQKRKRAVKLFRARHVRGRKQPSNEKEQLIAFTKALSEFVMHFGIELRNWLDTEPTMEAAGRTSLWHTLDAFALELQHLAQRVEKEGRK